jgi:hypothetical protein
MLQGNYLSMKIYRFKRRVVNAVVFLTMTVLYSGDGFTAEKTGVFSDWKLSPVRFSETPYKSKLEFMECRTGPGIVSKVDTR